MSAADLDPLGLDEFYAAVPLAARPAREVLDVLAAAIRAAGQLRLRRDSALAVLRDLDPLICKVETETPGAWQAVAGIEQTLLDCATLAGHIPRGDNATYGRHNPLPPRTRTFTHTAQEHALYRGLAMGESGLDQLICGLSVCVSGPVGQEVHAFAAEALASTWEPMVAAAKLMRKADVAPVMGEQIAPWVSHTFVINGHAYRGPTAAQLPVVLADWLLWGADSDDQAYRAYHRYYAGEQPGGRRLRVERALKASGGRSLVTRLAADLPRVAHDPLRRAAARRSLEGIAALLRRMHGFRAAHLAFARPSLPIRSAGEASWGTGEFDPEMLDRLLAHTITAHQRVVALLEPKGP